MRDEKEKEKEEISYRKVRLNWKRRLNKNMTNKSALKKREWESNRTKEREKGK